MLTRVRILVVSNLYPPAVVGGYEVCCAHTVQWLARRHELLVLTSSHGRTKPQRDEQVLRELPFLPPDMRGAARAPLASLQAARIMRRTLRDFQPDLIFVWNASRIPRAAIRIAQGWGASVAFSVGDNSFGYFVEGDQFLRLLSPGIRGIRRWWATFARAVNRLPSLRIELTTALPASIAWNSEAMRRMTTIPQGVAPLHERVIHPASFHEDLFRGVSRAPATAPSVLFVGRLTSEKAPDTACRAVALLRDRHGMDARLTLAGPGGRSDRRLLDRLLRELAITDRVEVRGPLPPEQIADLLATAHVLVVPSRWQEPFGLVCLEAALAHTPVVASMSGGMPEMLRPEEEALFFPIDDAAACAGALARVIEDPDAAATRARRAFARAGDYSVARYRAAYDAFVEAAVRKPNTLGSPPAPAPLRPGVG
jgi:glycogen synthase